MWHIGSMFLWELIPQTPQVAPAKSKLNPRITLAHLLYHLRPNILPPPGLQQLLVLCLVVVMVVVEVWVPCLRKECPSWCLYAARANSEGASLCSQILKLLLLHYLLSRSLCLILLQPTPLRISILDTMTWMLVVLEQHLMSFLVMWTVVSMTMVVQVAVVLLMIKLDPVTLLMVTVMTIFRVTMMMTWMSASWSYGSWFSLFDACCQRGKKLIFILLSHYLFIYGTCKNLILMCDKLYVEVKLIYVVVVDL